MYFYKPHRKPTEVLHFRPELSESGDVFGIKRFYVPPIKRVYSFVCVLMRPASMHEGIVSI